MATLKPYQPSNGTEGEGFMERFCYRCATYGPDDSGCNILLRTLIHNPGDFSYPREWTIEGINLRTAKCSAFTASPPVPGLCPVCNGLGLVAEVACVQCDGKGWVAKPPP